MISILTFILVAVTLSWSVEGAFDVNVCFTVGGKGVKNANVKCYDEDWGPDDRVGPSGGANTATNGCVTLRDTQTWFESPDVYCQIFPNGECFAGATTSIKNDHNSRTTANFGTIALTYDPDYCGDFGIGANGCGPASIPSWLRDVATSVSGFAYQCAAHDACYSNCAKTRSQCDYEFLNDMEAVCATSWTCLTLADLFYEAVSGYGGSACTSARTGKCTDLSLCNR